LSVAAPSSRLLRATYGYTVGSLGLVQFYHILSIPENIPCSLYQPRNSCLYGFLHNVVGICIGLWCFAELIRSRCGSESEAIRLPRAWRFARIAFTAIGVNVLVPLVTGALGGVKRSRDSATGYFEGEGSWYYYSKTCSPDGYQRDYHCFNYSVAALCFLISGVVLPVVVQAAEQESGSGKETPATRVSSFEDEETLEAP